MCAYQRLLTLRHARETVTNLGFGELTRINLNQNDYGNLYDLFRDSIRQVQSMLEPSLDKGIDQNDLLEPHRPSRIDS